MKHSQWLNCHVQLGQRWKNTPSTSIFHICQEKHKHQTGMWEKHEKEILHTHTQTICVALWRKRSKKKNVTFDETESNTTTHAFTDSHTHEGTFRFPSKDAESHGCRRLLYLATLPTHLWLGVPPGAVAAGEISSTHRPGDTKAGRTSEASGFCFHQGVELRCSAFRVLQCYMRNISVLVPYVSWANISQVRVRQNKKRTKKTQHDV